MKNPLQDALVLMVVDGIELQDKASTRTAIYIERDGKAMKVSYSKKDAHGKEYVISVYISDHVQMVPCKPTVENPSKLRYDGMTLLIGITPEDDRSKKMEITIQSPCRLYFDGIPGIIDPKYATR